jgi:hypothetical protein
MKGKVRGWHFNFIKLQVFQDKLFPLGGYVILKMGINCGFLPVKKRNL